MKEQQDPSSEQIKVALCIRPSLLSEESCQKPLQVSEDQSQVFVSEVGDCESESKSSNRRFNFDYIFGSEGKHVGDLYPSCIQPLTDGIFAGYNATVLAYGQTGSGKSYLMGTATEYLHQQRECEAVIPSAINNIFDRLACLNQSETKVAMRCSFIEMQQEQIKDLLSANKQSRVVLREPDPRKDAILEGLMEVQVQSRQDMLDCLYDGLKQRSVGATRTNTLSSRSHAVFTLKLTQTKPVDSHGGEEGVNLNDIIEGKIQFVDLAGSERLVKSSAEGVGRVEACSINKGLLAVGNVIEALYTQKRAHIPYRDHILTRVLRTSLGGNSRTVMIACVSPADIHLNETVSTLKYASRARSIINTPVASKGEANFALAELRNENNCLKDQILMLQARVRNNVDLTEEDIIALKSQMEEERQRRLLLENEVAVLKGEIIREKQRTLSLENQIEAIKSLAVQGQEAVELPFDHEPSSPSASPRVSESDSSANSTIATIKWQPSEPVAGIAARMKQRIKLWSFHSYNAFAFDVPRLRKRSSNCSNVSAKSIDTAATAAYDPSSRSLSEIEEMQQREREISRSVSYTWSKIGGELPQEVAEGQKVIKMDQNERFLLQQSENTDELLAQLRSNPFTIISDNKKKDEGAMLWQGETSVDSFVAEIVGSCCQVAVYDSLLNTHHNHRLSLLVQIDDINKRLQTTDDNQYSSRRSALQDHLKNLQNKVLQESAMIQKYNKISMQGKEWEENYLERSNKGDLWNELSNRDLTNLIHHLLIKAVDFGNKLHSSKQQLAQAQNEAVLQGRLHDFLKEHLIAKGHQIRLLENRLEKVSLTNQTLDIWAGQRQRAVQQKVWAYSQLAEQQEEMENLRFQIEKLSGEVEYLQQQLDESCSSVAITPDSGSLSGKNISVGELHPMSSQDYQLLIQEKMDSTMKAAQLQEENYQLRKELLQYQHPMP